MSDIVLAPFSEEWWHHVLYDTQNLTTPKTFRNTLSKQELVKLEEGVVEALRAKFVQHSGTEDLRIYLGEELASESFLERLFAKPPRETENLSFFIERNFEGHFCIILNKAECYSEKLSRLVMQKLNPLLTLIGIPALGADITIFIGNYGWTPLGIHRDKPGEDVFHLHLGPASKSIYCWDDDTYQEFVGGKQNNADIEPLLPYSTVHTQRAGDVFYMPWNFFHIGKTDELSVTVTVWLDNAPQEKYVKTIVGEYLRRRLENIQILLPRDLAELRSHVGRDEMESILGIDSDLLNLSMRDMILQADHEMELSLESNGGWQSHPLTLRESSRRKSLGEGCLVGKTVRLATPFKICYETCGEILTLFVRGRKLELLYLPQIVSMIQLINTGKNVELDDLLTIAGRKIPQQEVLLLVSLLVDKRGLDVVGP